MIQAVIFDFDGLLVDSEPLHFATEKNLVERYGGVFNSDLFSSTLGKSTKDVLAYYQQKCKLDVDLNTLIKEHDKIFLELVDYKLKLMPGTLELIKLLKKERIKFIIASSGTSTYLNKALKKIHLLKDFHKFVSIEMVRHGKPAPDLFLEASRILKVYPTNCLVLEDASNGIEAAIQAKMNCILINKESTIDIKFSSIIRLKNLKEINTEILRSLSICQLY